MVNTNQTIPHLVNYFLVLVFLFAATFGATAQRNNKARLLGFEWTECDVGIDVERVRIRIVDKVFTGDTLSIQVVTRAQCCIDFIPEITFKNDVLNLMYKESGTSCECTCAYVLTYRVLGLSRVKFHVKLQGSPITQSGEMYVTYPVRFEIFNGDTINRTDRFGLAQGYWNVKLKGERDYMRGFQKDGRWMYREILSYNANDSLRIKSFHVLYGEESSMGIQYYPDGKIRRQLMQNGDFRQELLFYPTGTLQSIQISGASTYQWRVFYPDGSLRMERFPKNEDHLWARYYYDTGELMAVHYVFSDYESMSAEAKWLCYDRNGGATDLQTLVDRGLIER